MYYSENPGSVRVDFFKYYDGKIGVWYTTEELDMSAYYDEPFVNVAIAKALGKHLWNGRHYRLSEMIAIVLEPYHNAAFPQAIPVNDIPSIILK